MPTILPMNAASQTYFVPVLPSAIANAPNACLGTLHAFLENAKNELLVLSDVISENSVANAYLIEAGYDSLETIIDAGGSKITQDIIDVEDLIERVGDSFPARNLRPE